VLSDLLNRSPSTKIIWGLERIRAILAALDDPHRTFRSILIGGTNGKGSVAAMAEALLRGHGYRTGLYTSPHLVDPAERIQITGARIQASLLEQCASEILPLAEREGATFFESITAVAFLAFSRMGVEQAVVEVGLGGRLDATNILTPNACVITNVALDHAEMLGGTLEQIGSEKVGIVKTRVPVVSGALPERVRALVDRRANALSAPLIQFGQDVWAEDVATSLTGTSFTYRTGTDLDLERFRIPLPGEHQAVNGTLALASVEAAGHALRPELCRTALADVRWPGRYQVLKRAGSTFVLDVAHNPAGVCALARTMDRTPLPEPIVGLIGILGDKPWQEMLEPILRRTTVSILTIPPSAPPSRHWNPEQARKSVPGHEVEVIGDFGRALARAGELAHAGTVLVTGSSHTVGDALRVLCPEGNEVAGAGRAGPGFIDNSSEGRS